MESDENTLYKGRHSEDETEKGPGRYWISLVALVLVGLGLLCTAVVLGVLLSDQPGVQITTADTLAAFHVPKTSTPRITRPSDEPARPDAKTSAAPINPAPFVPSNHTGSGECAWGLCLTLASWMRSSLDYNVDPCQDFYKYVCSKFRGPNEFINLERDIELSSTRYLLETKIPSSNQLSLQKAAAMFHACLAINTFSVSETPYLVEWIKSLDLDLVNETRLSTVRPAEMMVRGSLELGVEAVFSFTFGKTYFRRGKRPLELRYSTQQDIWRAKQHSRKDYENYVAMFGANQSVVQEVVSKIEEYEKELEATARNVIHDNNNSYEYLPVYVFGLGTQPYVHPDEWGTTISRCTNGTYGGMDDLYVNSSTLYLLNIVLESESVGIHGLRYLVAWTFFRQLLEFTEPSMFLRGRTVSGACYQHVKKVMRLAVITPYFRQAIPPYTVSRTKLMQSHIRQAYEKAVNSSSWLSSPIRGFALERLANMTIYMGSPGRRLDPEFVEELYKPYPDAPLDHLFPTWIKALSLSSHEPWTDQKYPLYDESAVSSEYSRDNFVIITAGMMHPPFLYKYGPLALNYGGLGMILAHEMTHAFDVKWTRKFRVTEPDGQRLLDEFKEKYTKKALCLRQAHKSVLSASGQQEALNDTVDSENLADLVGTVIAYAAFNSLPKEYKKGTLAGIDLSSEQLFFVSHCAKWCAKDSTPPPEFAPYRSRCIVPLMNMPEFATAFRCAAGSPMNPREKCTFW